MAPIAAVCRLSARAVTQQLRSHGTRRGFHTGNIALSAQNFNMPALSPTMTEGNIANWKVREGDAFVAGDVLLEIETDKAQMDVEAQDDGVLAKIMHGNGTKAVQVGTRIAVTAESGDDLASLEIPPEDGPAPKKADTAEESPKQEPASEPQAERDSAPAPETISSGSEGKASGGKAQKQLYPLYPSVQHLLMENGLPKEEADKIPATGPNGRLLKGDVLSYLGKIERSYASESSQRIGKLAHLDLSNIKPAAQKEAAKQKPATVSEAPKMTEDLDVEITLSVSFEAVTKCQKRVEESIGVFLPVSTFIARAAELANENLPRSKTAKPSADELFNAVLGLDKVAEQKSSCGNFIPHVTALPPTNLRNMRPATLKQPDIIDILAGKKPARATRRIATIGAENVVAPLNVFSVNVPKGDEKRGRTFLERVKNILEVEPGRLVV